MFINGMSVLAYRRKTASERSKANISGLRLATFHTNFANNLMFQLKLRNDNAQNLHLQIIK